MINEDKKCVCSYQDLLTDGLVTQTIMNNSYDTIYFKDLNSKFILNSQAHASQLGAASVCEMVGKTDFDYFPERFATRALQDEKQVIESGVPIIGQVEKWVQEDGRVTWFSASKYPLFDRKGSVVGTWGTSREITKLKVIEEELERLNQELMEANLRLEEQSIRDGLSGLYNHRYFYEVLGNAYAQSQRVKVESYKEGFSVVFIDIDHFKSINDQYGHRAGDVVIQRVGEELLRLKRATDYCFRYGGDEFAVILMGATLDDGKRWAEKTRRELEMLPIHFEEGVVTFTASIGVASSDEASHLEDVVEIADARLYDSKENGRNCVT